MGMISDILGLGRPKSGPRTIADVELALGRLSAERTAARRAVDDARRERAELLLVDQTDERIAALDAAAHRAELTLERLDLAEPLLLRELEQLRSEAKQARWRGLREGYDAAAIDYANALRVAVEKMAVMLNLNDEARRAGFEHETQAAFIPPTRMISPDALNQFEVAIERAREMARPRSAPTPMPKPAPAVDAPTKPIAAPPKAAKPIPKAERQRIVEPAGPGQVQARVQRSGYEANGRQYAQGDIIALAAETARQAIQNGALDGVLQ